MRLNIGVTGAWEPGDKWTLSVTDVDGDHTIGAGRVSGKVPTLAMTWDQKLYFVSGDTLYFSDINDPEHWEKQHPGAGFITMSNSSSGSEALTGLAPYQGRMAVKSRSSAQIWHMDADPANNSQSQVLANVGTIAPLSVQPVGDMDIYFLSDTGVRSLRVRDASGNAVLADMGTPVDTLIQAALSGLNEEQKARACGTVDPRSNRYWLSIANAAGTDATLYVLSYFVNSQIQAWSTYKPTYKSGGVQVPFVPEKWQTFNGRIFCRAGDKVFAYGGADGESYDNCTVTWITPFLDAKQPATEKGWEGFDAAMEGSWVLSVCADPYAPTRFQEVYRGNFSTFGLGRIPYQANSTHLALKGVCSAEGKALFSSALLHFNMGAAS